MTVRLANYIWRGFNIDGVSSSGPNMPDPALIRPWGTWLESLANLAFTNGRVYATKAALDADLTPAAFTPAIVVGDPAVGNDGLYMKVGGAGAGSWLRLLDFVPGTQIVHAFDVGAGTPNAIVATTSLAVSAGGSQIIRLDVFESNTGSPVTVAFNGGSALTIKTASGNDVVAGGLTAGPVLGVVSGSTFRLLSDQASAAVLSAAESAEANAAASAAIAEGFASDIVSQGNVPIYATLVGMPALSIPVGINALRINGYSAAGDGGAALYKKVVAEPTHAGKFQSADGAWWERAMPRVFILASAQSNGGELAYAWSPPKNLFTKNSGTNWIEASGAVISTQISFAAEVARANPEKDVFLYVAAGGGLDIGHWIGGLNYLFDTGTADSAPANGDIKFNNAAPASVTELYVSIFTPTLVRKIFPLATASAGRTVTIAKASDPTVFAKYTVVSNSFPVVGSMYFKAVVTYHSHNGAIANNDPVKVRIEPFMYEDRIFPDVPAIFAEIGVSSPDVVHWWQGESDVDAGFGYAEYIADHNILRARMLSDGLINEATPWVIHGIQSEANDPTRVGYDAMNIELLKLVQSHAETDTFVYTAVLPVSFWDAPAALLHVNAAGAEAAGKLSASNFQHGTGRKSLGGLITELENGGIAYSGATGGAKGNGTINASKFYQNGVSPSSYVRTTVVDDGVVSYNVPPDTAGFGVFLLRSAGYFCLFHWISSGTSPLLIAITEGGAAALIDQTTGILSGTTGVDGRITLSIHTDNKIYIENRTGNATAIITTLFGGA